MEISEKTASQIFDIANIALVISLAVGVMATVLIVWMGGIKERKLQVEVGDAHASAEIAKRDAAKAYADAAKANELSLQAQLALEREKMARLELEAQVETVRDYSDVSRLTFNGTLYTGGDIILPTEYSEVLKGTYYDKGNNNFSYVRTTESREKLLDASKRYPRFPFSFYWLAVWLHDDGDPHWREYATAAIAIFQKTTAIAGHHGYHDTALAYMLKLTRESPPSPIPSEGK